MYYEEILIRNLILKAIRTSSYLPDFFTLNARLGYKLYHLFYEKLPINNLPLNALIF